MSKIKIKTVAIVLLLLAARLASAEDPQISSFAELQAAIDAAPPHSEVVLRVKVHVRDMPLNMRNKIGLTLRCEGAGGLDVRYGPAGAQNWTVIDAVGSEGCRFLDLYIHSKDDADWIVHPACAVLLGRLPNLDDPDDPRSSAGHIFVRCNLGGTYRQACIYNVGSEVVSILDCSLKNELGAGYMTCSWNVKGVRSPFGNMAGGPRVGGPGRVCNAVHRIERTHFRMTGVMPGVAQLPAGGFLNISNCTFSVQGNSPCAIYIGHRVGWSQTPVPCWGGVMIGNEAEHGRWYTPDVVFATTFRDLGSTRGREGYPDVMKLNPGFRHGLMHIDCLMKDFPHP